LISLGTAIGAAAAGQRQRIAALETRTVIVTGTEAVVTGDTQPAGTIRFATDTGRIMVSTGSTWVGTGIATPAASATSGSSITGAVVTSGATGASATSGSSITGSIVTAGATGASATSGSSITGAVVTAGATGASATSGSSITGTVASGALSGEAIGEGTGEGTAVGSTTSGALSGEAIGEGSGEGTAIGSVPASQTDVINLSPSLFHRSEDIADTDSDGYANTWVEYGGGTQYQQDSWGTSHPYYISSDADFNNHAVVDFSGSHYMTLRTATSAGNSAQHYFIVFAWANSSNWGTTGYIHGNPWGTANRLQVSSLGQHNLGGWKSFVGLDTATASNWNDSTNTIRKNGQVLSAAEQLYTPLMNIRDTSGNTWKASAASQTATVNSTSEWTKPVLYEWESNGTKTFNPRWFGRYSSGLVIPMKVAEIVGYSSALSSTDAATVRSYLGSRYNIQMT
jgi:hypothetical protein